MPGGQRLRGDVAVALVVWVTSLVDWAMPGLREALSGKAGSWGWFLRRGARRTPRRNSAK